MDACICDTLFSGFVFDEEVFCALCFYDVNTSVIIETRQEKLKWYPSSSVQ